MNKLPYVRGLYHEKLLFYKNSCYPPGHYYSTVISVEDVKNKQDEIWGACDHDGVEGIDLNIENQVRLVQSFESIIKNCVSRILKRKI